VIDLKPHTKGAETKHFPAIVENNTVDGKLIAMPWYIDAPVPYYRKDLPEYGASVPETRAQLTVTAENIQKAERQAGNDKFWGDVWQGRAHEGLTCDVEPDGKVSWER
jgi:trehalose/maltose transport system substrate-binding protein